MCGCLLRQRIWGSMGMTQSLIGDKDCWLQARYAASPSFGLAVT